MDRMDELCKDAMEMIEKAVATKGDPIISAIYLRNAILLLENAIKVQKSQDNDKFV